MAILHMKWQPQHRQQQRRRPLGLKNLGNTCYLNSVLQCLTYTPPLAQYCLSNQHSSLCKTVGKNRDKECPFCILERQIARLLTLEGPMVDTPSKIQKCVTLFAEHFRWGRQEDAHEFLRYAIEACHNTCLKLIKKLASSSFSASNGKGNADTGPCSGTVMNEIFGGVLLSQVKCMSCKGESNKTDEIMDISLDIFQISSVKDALGRFFQPEVLDGNNKYNCSKCKKLSVAKKQMFILRAPNVLVIQLKRFEGIHGGKINKNIEFEEALVLSKFMCSTTQDLQPEYSLCGSIVHSGFSPDSGHYYSYIKDPLGRWYCCNDAHVSLSSTQEVLSEKVYILFYLRNNQSPRPGKAVGPFKAKTSDPSGSEILPHQKTAGLSKPPVVRPNGLSLSSSKNNGLAISKNGKIITSPQMKFTNSKKPEMKKVIANGNGSHEVHTHGSLENNEDHEPSPPVKKNTTHFNGSMKYPKVLNEVDLLSSSSKSNAVDGISADMLENGREHMQRVANGNGNGNGYSNLLKVEVHEDRSSQKLTAVDREIDDDHPTNNMLTENDATTAASKRKSCDTERDEGLDVSSKKPHIFSQNDAPCKTQTPYDRHPCEELENFKELITSEASTFLRSCGWVDKVQDFMHTRKRTCTQGTDNCLNHTELRRQLKVDAQRAFLSQIPESLKEHLIERLRSFSKGKRLLDT